MRKTMRLYKKALVGGITSAVPLFLAARSLVQFFNIVHTDSKSPALRRGLSRSRRSRLQRRDRFPSHSGAFSAASKTNAGVLMTLSSLAPSRRGMEDQGYRAALVRV